MNGVSLFSIRLAVRCISISFPYSFYDDEEFVLVQRSMGR